MIGLKRIHEDAIAPQFRDVAEQKIGENFYVGTDAGQQHCKQGAIQHTVRVIRDNHYGPSGGNPLLIRAMHLQLNPHLGEQSLQAKTLRRTLHPPVEVSNLADRRQFPGQAGKLSNPGQYFAVRLTRTKLVQAHVISI